MNWLVFLLYTTLPWPWPVVFSEYLQVSSQNTWTELEVLPDGIGHLYVFTFQTVSERSNLTSKDAARPSSVVSSGSSWQTRAYQTKGKRSNLD